MTDISDDRSREWFFKIMRPPSLREISIMGVAAAMAGHRMHHRATSVAKPAPSTPTSKRAKVKAARKQRQRNG